MTPAVCPKVTVALLPIKNCDKAPSLDNGNATPLFAFASEDAN